MRPLLLSRAIQVELVLVYRGGNISPGNKIIICSRNFCFSKTYQLKLLTASVNCISKNWNLKRALVSCTRDPYKCNMATLTLWGRPCGRIIEYANHPHLEGIPPPPSSVVGNGHTGAQVVMVRRRTFLFTTSALCAHYPAEGGRSCQIRRPLCNDFYRRQ